MCFLIHELSSQSIVGVRVSTHAKNKKVLRARLWKGTCFCRNFPAGSWQRSESCVFLRRYGCRSRQPSSSSLARRACVHVLPFCWYSCFYAVRRYVTGTRLLQVRLLGLRKRPWPLWRPRRDGNGARFVRSPCLPSWRGLRLLYAVYQMLSLGPCAATVH